ncbi:GntR family transcriptional regulator [Streptomyces sp. NPDC060366]|uniref:GntR family transcriptional regulator n=1 Tax=Streptomyces sp. NPDC060366 TaxID=3347105 RepID=UPI003654D2BD
MPDPSPRGTYLKIVDQVKARIEADPGMTELPPVADLMAEYGVSRGLILRVFRTLKHERVAEPVPGGRWRIIRDTDPVDRRPLHERLAEVITLDELEVGALFPSATVLSDRFGMSRPTVSKALDKLEAAGLLSATRQGKPRTVLALPDPNAN